MRKSQNHGNSFVHNLTIEQKEYAAKVLNESDKNRENAIAEIKCWIQENDLCLQTDDFFILRFLRVCKFNIENTKIKMRNYQKYRASIVEWYANRDPLQPKLQKLLNLGISLPLRKLDNQGRMVIFTRFLHDPNIFTLDEVVKAACMILDVAIRNSIEASLYGVVNIVDLKYVTLRHMTQIGPRTLMNSVHTLQSCYPIRIQMINFINAPEYTKYFLACMKYFMSSKLKQRLHVYTYSTTPNLFANMSTNILPIEYGGTDGTIQELTEYWKKVIEDNRDWFINEKY